jgi:hypothetical protein
MASAFAQRVARSKARRQGGSQPVVGGSAFADRIARSKARREGRGEEEEEERGLLSRVWYGEEEGEGGRMGIEDIPGQFADVALSPIEKGLKPLIDLGAGAGKIAFGQEEDEDTRLARMAGSEMVESVTGLPEAFESGYPVEGVMNLAAAATLPFTGGGSIAGLAGKVPKLGALAKAGSKLDRIAGHKAMRVADVVADPMSYVAGKGIGKAAKGVVAGSRAAKRAVTGDRGDAGGPGTERKGVIGEGLDALKDVESPGRRWTQEVAEYIQSFTTGLPQSAVGRMYDYLVDPNKRKRNYEIMKKARNDPDKAIKGIVTRIQQKIKDMSDSEGDAFRDAKAEFLASEKVKGNRIETDFQLDDSIGDRVNNLLNPSSEQTGFGGRLLIKYKRYERTDKDGVRHYGPVETSEWAARADVPKDAQYKYDIEWRDVEKTKSDLPTAQQNLFKKELLDNVLQNSPDFDTKNTPLSVSDALTESVKFEKELGTPEMRIKMGPSDAFRAKLKDLRREIVRDAAGEDAANKMDAANEAYKDHRTTLDQLQENYGSKIGDTDVNYKQQQSKLYGDVLDSPDRLDGLQQIVGDDGVLELLGAAHSSAFGGGLVVRSNFSNLIRAIPTLLYAGGVTSLSGAIAGIPLLMVFSPKAMLPISNFLAKRSTMRRAVRGGEPKMSDSAAAKSIIKATKDAEKLLGAQGTNLRKLAKEGMTFGQLMQRLEREAEREQRQG